MKICKLIYCFVFLVFSCKKKDIVSQMTLPTISSQETKLTPNEVLALQTSYGKTKVEESEAAEIALDFVRFAEVNSKNVNARSSADAGRFLADSKVVWLNQNATKNMQGRVLDDSIPLYVYQFRTALDNTAGFAIVSGDTRLPQVLACTFDGSIEDTLKETGAKILIANISSFVEHEIERQNIELQTQLSSALEKIKRQMPDSIKKILDPKAEVKGNLRMEGAQIWQLQNVKLGNWETLASLGPLLKTKWGQGYPYNLKIPYACNGVRAPVGCQATAAAQIMAYWRFPNTYNGVTINWDNIVNWSQNTMPISVLFVTVAQLANMNYGCTQSGTDNYNIFKSYDALGYQANTNVDRKLEDSQNYDLAVIYQSLSNAMPVHTTGYTSDLKSGHAWVIDGNRYRRRAWVGSMVLYDDNVPIYGYLTGGYLEEHFLQCNFGWDGNSDGLYASGLFNTGSYSFVSKLKIIPFISPK